MTTVLFIAGGIAVFLLLIGVVVTITSEKSLVQERLGRYLQEEAAVVEGKPSPVGDWLNLRLEKSNLGGGIARELARADLKLKASEYVALVVISSVLVAIIAYFFFGRSWIFALGGAVLGTLLPRMYVRRQQSRRLIRFNDQLPDMLNLMVNGLRAGFSSMQAMETVAKELPAPISEEFRRVVQEIQFGLPTERALDNLLRRIPSDDLDLTIAAMNVQREVGGNLAEILDTISYTIRERVRIKGEIRVLTAQQVYSGRFLALIPVITSLLLYVVNRPYMMTFLAPESRMVGIPALICAVGLILAGFVVMNKISQIEV